jgi:hypothetical protein
MLRPSFHLEPCEIEIIFGRGMIFFVGGGAGSVLVPRAHESICTVRVGCAGGAEIRLR